MVKLTEQIVAQQTKLDNPLLVKNLNIWGRELHDISIIGQMPNVEVLSLSINKINTLKDLRNCTIIHVVLNVQYI